MSMYPHRSSLFIPQKRKVFVSYHHVSDQKYYDLFIGMFCGTYDVIHDNSLDRLVDSDDPEYVMRRIRENNITGSSCTIVLCGPETRWRKYVDWETKATLDKQHGLIGINLPNNHVDSYGKVNIPDRLYDNIISGYALWLQWHDLTKGVQFFTEHLKLANQRARSLIVNNREMRRRNG